MVRACLFVRVSTDEQSTERQISDLTFYAKNRNWDVVKTISETVSGAVNNDQRAGIRELMAAAKAKQFDKVLVTELSRLGRNAYQVNTLIHDMTDMGISIAIQTLGIETLTPDGKTSPMVDLMIAIINQFSQMERQFLIERINSGIARVKAQGKHLGRPFGAVLTGDALMRKYKPVVHDLQQGIPIRKIAAIHDISTRTVQKIKHQLGVTSGSKERQKATKAPG